MPFNGDYDGSIVAILEQLRLTADLEGLAVLDLSEDAVDRPIVYCLGIASPHTTELGQALLSVCPSRPSHATAPDTRAVLACPWVLPPSRPGGVLLWRGPHSPPWAEADHDLAAAMIMLLRFAIGGGLGQPGIDRLTGLPNRHWFLHEGDRRIERLDRDKLAGTLALIDIADLRSVTMTIGRELNDRVLVRVCSQVRDMLRSSDMVARVGPGELALWLDGMDYRTAAERADVICSRRWIQDWPCGDQVTVSIGIAARPPGSTEDIRALLRRAHVAVREVKSNGGGGWRVSEPCTTSRFSGLSA